MLTLGETHEQFTRPLTLPPLFSVSLHFVSLSFALSLYTWSFSYITMLLIFRLMPLLHVSLQFTQSLSPIGNTFLYSLFH